MPEIVPTTPNPAPPPPQSPARPSPTLPSNVPSNPAAPNPVPERPGQRPDPSKRVSPDKPNVDLPETPSKPVTVHDETKGPKTKMPGTFKADPPTKTKIAPGQVSIPQGGGKKK